MNTGSGMVKLVVFFTPSAAYSSTVDFGLGFCSHHLRTVSLVNNEIEAKLSGKSTLKVFLRNQFEPTEGDDLGCM